VLNFTSSDCDCQELGAGVAQSVYCLTRDWAIEVRSPAEAESIFPPASVSRLALRTTKFTVQWLPGVVSPGVKRSQGVMLTP
jgi:hypothetical protein